jgi:hypothetical protein
MKSCLLSKPIKPGIKAALSEENNLQLTAWLSVRKTSGGGICSQKGHIRKRQIELKQITSSMTMRTFG